jgi:hypothetical protein
MRKALPWIIAAVAALAVAAGWYWWQQRAAPPAPVPSISRVEPPAEPPTAPPAAPQTPAVHPIEQVQPEAPRAAEPPPAMADSDKFIMDALVGLLGRDAVLSHFNVGDYVRRAVATVDSLPSRRAPARFWPITPTPGSFKVIEKDETAFADPANAQRYVPLVKLIEAADTGRFVALYVRLYPLFQQAYAELGHSSRHFNDRLVEVIDHLLAAPEVKGPVALAKPWIMWEYADPKLEALSAGHKILVRVGPENAARLKAKLREVRRQVAAAPVKG